MAKFRSYLTREFRDMLLFHAIPALCVVLSWRQFYGLLNWICEKGFFFRKQSAIAYNKSVQILGHDIPEVEWKKKYRLLLLLDISDYYLIKYAKSKVRKLIPDFKSDLTKSQGGLALSMHWGPGFLGLLSMHRVGLVPQFVFNANKPDYSRQSFFERRYRIKRRKLYDQLAGSHAIKTGGSFQKIIDAVNSGCTPVILFDAPASKPPMDALQILTVNGYSYPISSGLFHLIKNNDVPIAIYFIGVNLDNGCRTIETIDLKNRTPEHLHQLLQQHFSKKLKETSYFWYFWNSTNNFQRVKN